MLKFTLDFSIILLNCYIEKSFNSLYCNFQIISCHCALTVCDNQTNNYTQLWTNVNP